MMPTTTNCTPAEISCDHFGPAVCLLVEEVMRAYDQ